jgi:hypothetical protein
MFKIFLNFLLALFLTLTIVSCGGEDDNENPLSGGNPSIGGGDDENETVEVIGDDDEDETVEVIGDDDEDETVETKSDSSTFATEMPTDVKAIPESLLK